MRASGMRRSAGKWFFRLVVMPGMLCGPAQATEVIRIAASDEVSGVIKGLTDLYKQTRQVGFEIISGETDELDAQVRSGVSFDLFLTADRRRIEAFERERLTIPDSRVTYATERLMFWIPGRKIDDSLERILRTGGIRRIAFADPARSSAGSAAQQILRRLAPGKPLQQVRSGTDAEVLNALESGAVEAGFVTRAGLRALERRNRRSLAAETLPVDASLHAPIEQQGMLMASAGDKAAARDFLEFILSDQAQSHLVAAGYASPNWVPEDCHACERPKPKSAQK